MTAGNMLPADWNEFPVAKLKTLTPIMRRLLREKNIVTCGTLARTREETLLGARGVGDATVDKMLLRVRMELIGLGYDLAPALVVLEAPADTQIAPPLPAGDTAGGQSDSSGYRWFIEQFVLRRAGTVTGELSGAQAVYEAKKAWTRMVEMAGGVA